MAKTLFDKKKQLKPIKDIGYVDTLNADVNFRKNTISASFPCILSKEMESKLKNNLKESIQQQYDDKWNGDIKIQSVLLELTIYNGSTSYMISINCGFDLNHYREETYVYTAKLSDDNIIELKELTFNYILLKYFKEIIQ